MSEKRLREHLARLVEEGVFTSVVASVGSLEGPVWEAAAGEAGPGEPAGAETLFDYASLTKPFVATLALALDAEGELSLATPVGAVWPGAHPDLAGRTLEDLLRHRSGLAGWTPLYTRCRTPEEAVGLLLAGGDEGDLLGAPPGTYSDLGFVLWAATAERLSGALLAELVSARVLRPLGLPHVVTAPGERPGLAKGVPVPVEYSGLAHSRMGTGMEVELAAQQGRQIADLGPPAPGRPQDGNARFLLAGGFGGGLCPHVGLFGRARDLRSLALEWLRPGRLLDPEAVRRAVESPAASTETVEASGAIGFHLGWWRPSPLEGGGGPAVSAASFGHTGFAGGSLWADPEGPQGGSIYVLLGSRTDPSLDMNRWRREFHTFAAGLLNSV